MTPGALTALLVVYWSADAGLQRSLMNEALALHLAEEGLIQQDSGSQYWRTTEKGGVLIEALCAVPMPIPSWKVKR